MDETFYRDLFDYFMAVAWKEAPRVAANPDACREIFHDRVLFPRRVESVAEAEARIKGAAREFASVKAYKNYLYAAFKNAIIDHLRDLNRRGRRDQAIDDDDLIPQPDVPAPEEHDERRQLAHQIFIDLSREERRLLALRYVENMTLVEIGKILSVSKSTVDRRETLLEAKVLARFGAAGRYDDEEVRLILSFLLTRIAEEDRGHD